MLIKQQRDAHAHQFRRANKALKKLKTYLGRVMRDIAHKITGDQALEATFASALRHSLALPADWIRAAFLDSRIPL